MQMWMQVWDGPVIPSVILEYASMRYGAIDISAHPPFLAAAYLYGGNTVSLSSL